MSNTPSETKTSNRPVYEAIVPVKDEADNTTWQKIGAAWNAKDQRGLNLVLTEWPFPAEGSRTIYLRSPKLAQATAPAESGESQAH